MTESSCVIPGSFSECQRIRRNSGTGMDGVTRVIVDQFCDLLQETGDKKLSDQHAREEFKGLLDKVPRKDRKRMFEISGPKGNTMLMAALQANQVDLVKFMLSNYPYNLKEAKQNYPLHVACALGQEPMTKVLLDLGAKADLLCNIRIPNVNTPRGKMSAFSFVLDNDTFLCLHTLLEHKSSKGFIPMEDLMIEACKRGALECGRYLAACCPKELSGQDDKGSHMLKMALVYNEQIAHSMLELGAQLPSNITEEWPTVLHELFSSETKSNILTTSSFLLNKAGPNLLKTTDEDGNTALHLLASRIGEMGPTAPELVKSSTVDTLTYLLAVGVDVNAINNFGNTAMHLLLMCARRSASRTGYSEEYNLSVFCDVIKILLDNGADPTCGDSQMLFYATRLLQVMRQQNLVESASTMLKMYELLLTHGSDINVKNSYGIPVPLQVLQKILHQTNFVERHYDFPVNFVMEVFQLFLEHNLDLTTSIAYRDPQSNKEHETSYITEIIAAVDRHTFQRNQIKLQDFKPLIEMLVSKGGGADPLPFTNAPETCHTAYTSDKESVLHQAILHIAVYCQPCEKCAVALECLLILLQTLDPAEADKFGKDLMTDSTWEHLGENASLTIERKKLVSDVLESHKSLQKFCQVKVAKCLTWKLDTRLDELPIPKKLMIFPWDKDTSQNSEDGSSLPSSTSGSPDHKAKPQDSESDIWDDKITEPEITLYRKAQNAKTDEESTAETNQNDSLHDLDNDGSGTDDNQTAKSKHTGNPWDEEFGVQSMGEIDFVSLNRDLKDNQDVQSTAHNQAKDQSNKNSEIKTSEDDQGSEIGADSSDKATSTQDNESTNALQVNVGQNRVDQSVDSVEVKNKNIVGIDGEEYSDNSISISETSRSASPISRNDIKLDADLENTPSKRFEYEDSDDEEKIKTNNNAKGTDDKDAKGEMKEDDEDAKSDDTNSVD